jgi:tripartite-type tricarboxylate transporter receptor subunit TctC
MGYMNSASWGATLCLGSWLAATAAFGQGFPAKPIRVVTAEAGGGNDFVARIVQAGLSAELGQPVVIENRLGVISAEAVSKAAPDGYTLLLTGSSFWVSPFFREVPYDPVKQFSPVTMTTSSPNILVVHPSLPVKSVKELISLAKARPGELNYATSSPGSPSHLTAELLKAMTGINIVRINYKGTGPALTGAISGQVQLMISPAGAVAPYIKPGGRLKPIAVTSARPSELVPGLPPVAATVPGYEVVSIIGFFAPIKTPDAVISRFQQAVASVMRRPDVKERFFNSGAEAVGSTPAEFGAALKVEMAKWGKLIRETGLKED